MYLYIYISVVYFNKLIQTWLYVTASDTSKWTFPHIHWLIVIVCLQTVDFIGVELIFEVFPYVVLCVFRDSTMRSTSSSSLLHCVMGVVIEWCQLLKKNLIDWNITVMHYPLKQDIFMSQGHDNKNKNACFYYYFNCILIIEMECAMEMLLNVCLNFICTSLNSYRNLWNESKHCNLETESYPNST